MKGTTEIGLAITLSTLTTMVVFLPIILMSGDADFSFFMSELGMPVVWALGTSLLVALFFTPLTTTIIRNSGPIADPGWVVALSKRYRRMLTWMLTRRTDALVGVLGMIFITFVVPVKSVGCSESGQGNIGEFNIRYQVSGDASYYDRRNVVEKVDEFVIENKERWGVRTWRARMRDSGQRGNTTVYLETDREEGQMSREDVIDDAKERLPEIPGVSLRIGWGGGGGSNQNRMSVYLHGEDTRVLETLGNTVQRVLENVDGVVGVISELEEDGGQEIRLDRGSYSGQSLRHQPAAHRTHRRLRLRASPLPFQDGKSVEVMTASSWRTARIWRDCLPHVVTEHQPGGALKALRTPSSPKESAPSTARIASRATPSPST